MTHNLYKKNQIHIKSALALGRRAQCLSKEVKMGFLARLMWEKLLYQSKKTLFFEIRLKIDRVLNFSSDTVNETRVRRDRHIAHKFL